MGLWSEIFSARANVTVDDGGVRCVTARGGVYVPFAALADASVRLGLGFGIAVLRLVMRDTTRRAFRIAPNEALEVQGEILQGLAAVPPERAPHAERLPRLARRDRPLLAWLADVAEIGAGGDGYRGAALDEGAVHACFADAAAEADLRAACAHALLATAREDAVVEVARAFVARPLPPIVIVAARLGRAGAALVPDAMCEDALPLLAPADAEAARGAMTAPRTHEDEDHAHALLLGARDEALREHAKSAPQPHAKRFRARGVGGYAGEQGVTRFK